jgi:hypothetical protein
MNKASLPVITVLTLLGHVASERRKYVIISSKIQTVLSSNLGNNSLKFTFPLTFLQTEGFLNRG